MKARIFTVARLSRAIAFITILSGLLPRTASCAQVIEVPENTNATGLLTRTFKLDPTGLNISFPPIALQSEMTKIFGSVDDGKKRSPRMTSAGIDPENEMRLTLGNLFNAEGVNLAPPKGLAYYRPESLLTIRATDEDLKLIEQAINTLTNILPEVQITVQAYELSDEAYSDLQLKWFSKFALNNNETKGSVTGILTTPAFNSILKSLDAKNSKDLLSKQAVTTLSGRDANFHPREPEVEPKTPVGGSVNYGFAHPLELDVVPKVDADGYTIQMALIPTANEFVAAGSDTNFVSAASSGGTPITGQLPLPRSRVRQLVTSCTLWDGQTATLVLQPPYAQTNKMLVVFVTPVIIEPNGNRKNAPGSLPFVEKTVPPQTVH